MTKKILFFLEVNSFKVAISLILLVIICPVYKSLFDEESSTKKRVI